MRKNNKGFTLIEMLIVVAIIAILVAVSIPLVNNSLEKAREAADEANERAAKAEAVILWLNDEWDSRAGNVYDAASGKFASTATGYGKCENHDGQSIVVTGISDDGEVTITWDGSSANNHLK